MLAIYMPRMRNNNLEIRIAGDKRSPQLDSQNAVCITLSPPPPKKVLIVMRTALQTNVDVRNTFKSEIYASSNTVL